MTTLIVCLIGITFVFLGSIFPLVKVLVEYVKSKQEPLWAYLFAISIASYTIWYVTLVALLIKLN
jgi:hypothetical protein